MTYQTPALVVRGSVANLTLEKVIIDVEASFPFLPTQENGL